MHRLQATLPQRSSSFPRSTNTTATQCSAARYQASLGAASTALPPTTLCRTPHTQHTRTMHQQHATLHARNHLIMHTRNTTQPITQRLLLHTHRVPAAHGGDLAGSYPHAAMASSSTPAASTNAKAPQQPGRPSHPQDHTFPLKAIAAATALVVTLLALRTAADRISLGRRGPADNAEPPAEGPSTLQAAREAWEASAPEDWWKAKLAQREAEEAALDFWASSSSSGDDEEGDAATTAGTGAGVPLSPAEQWQAVKQEEWWKTDAIKDDPQWWTREREAFGGGVQTANGNGAGNSNGNGAGNGNGNGVVGDVADSANAAADRTVGFLGEAVKREAQFAVDSAMARLMAMRLALTRPARQRAFEKEDKGPCLYEVDPSACTQEQQTFLERKAKALRGEGPLIPESSNCARCQGTGKNSKGVEEIMGNSMENIIPRNGVVEVRWNLLKGGPCFLCQGRNGCIVGCPDCQGTGIVGYVTKYKE